MTSTSDNTPAASSLTEPELLLEAIARLDQGLLLEWISGHAMSIEEVRTAIDLFDDALNA